MAISVHMFNKSKKYYLIWLYYVWEIETIGALRVATSAIVLGLLDLLTNTMNDASFCDYAHLLVI